jgi:hypothetical protein
MPIALKCQDDADLAVGEEGPGHDPWSNRHLDGAIAIGIDAAVLEFER